MSYLLTSILAFLMIILSVESKINRPRGVSPLEASFYQVGEHFTCITSSEKILYTYINDNYCDCEDGSDEPGTSACANRSFYCPNKGYLPTIIPSSRVDDGICDCCDGSDEDGEKIQCQNLCDEMGKREREERQRKLQMQEEGYKVKEEYIQKGKAIAEEKKSRVGELSVQKEALVKERDALEVTKTETEAPEKEAKDKHEKAWEAEKAQKQAQKDQAAAQKAFNELDSNDDQHIDMTEMKVHAEFDIDSDGVVSHDEAKEHLEDLEKVNLEEFVSRVWPNIKEIYKSPAFQEEVRHAEQEAHLPAAEVDDSETTPPTPAADEDKEKKEEEEKMPEYDDETNGLIEAADAARAAFKDAEDKVRNADSEILDINRYLELDLGPDNEYGVLKGQCFEYTEREYIYRLCPFDKTIQKPKSGGSETSLGNWGHWDGPANDKYAAQKYEKGLNCWNGPDRSVRVILHCGTENVLTSASEPSRCEYQFDFTTPARCSKPTADDYKQDTHDEL